MDRPCNESGSGLARIGVGLLYNPEVPPVLEHRPEAVDLLAITPDVLQVDRLRQARRRPAAAHRFADIEALVETVLALARAWPMVGHGVGLSIGSPRPLDRGYVGRMRTWVERLGMLWYSEHLSFFRLPRGSTAAHEAGLACPLPFDLGVLDAVSRRARTMQAALEVPFLLENGVTYVRPVDDDLSEPEFLNRLCADAGTGLLLDLHNLHVNAVNHGFDAAAWIDAIDGDAVREVHLAGGDTMLGYYTDAHSGAVPEQVWSLLRLLLPKAPHLLAVTFEYHESVAARLGIEGVLGVLERIREEIDRAGRRTGMKGAGDLAARPDGTRVTVVA